MNGNHDAALGRSIKFGKDNTGEFDRFGELLGLDQTVLSGRRIDHEEHFGDRTCSFVGHSANFAEFFHEVDLVVEATSCISQHEINVARVRCFDAIEDHRARIATFVSSNQFCTGTFGPHSELFRSCCTKCVAGRHKHTVALTNLSHSEFADRRGLANPVNADEQPHRRTRFGREMKFAVESA